MVLIKRLLVLACCLLLSVQIVAAEDIIYSDQEIIRNGDFERGDNEAWHNYICLGGSVSAKDGGYGQRINEIEYFFQQLVIPHELDSAAIRLDYRVIEHGTCSERAVVMHVAIGRSAGFDSEHLEEDLPLTIVSEIYSEKIEGTFDWKEYAAPLSPETIAAIKEAHAAGEFCFLVFYCTPVEPVESGMCYTSFSTDFDNISLKATGTQRVPAMQGKIAYLEDGEEGDPCAIGILDPNTRASNTIWKHPEGKFGKWSNVAWSPDASQIAFVSDHDFSFQIGNEGIFSIKPDGSGLQRMPRIPSQDDIENGDYPRITVNGNLLATTGAASERYSIILGIEGTNKGVMLIAAEGESVPFTIPDVPVLGDQTIFKPIIIMHWYSLNCSGGLDYAYPVANISGGIADVGTINFYGANCCGALAFNHPHDMSWKHDGSEIGFSMTGLWKLKADLSEQFSIEQLACNNETLVSGLSFSPVDNRYLFSAWSFTGATDFLYLMEEGVAEEPKLGFRIQNGVAPAWLPDGSGFIYLQGPESDANLYQYDFASGQSKRLSYFENENIEHLSISPDGGHIVFEMNDEISNPHREFWIMDRLHPVNMWKVSEGGKFRSPDWSRKEVSLESGGADEGGGTAEDGAVNPSGGTAESGGGGGGCFIAACR